MCHILKGIGTSCCPSMVTGDLFRSKSDKRAFFLKKKNKIKKEVWIKKKQTLITALSPSQCLHFCFDSKRHLPLRCHYSWRVQAWSDPRVTRPPGCECVSLSCVAGFLILCWLLTASGCSPKCWVCHPSGGNMSETCRTNVRVHDHLWGFLCGFSHERVLNGASLKLNS